MTVEFEFYTSDLRPVDPPAIVLLEVKSNTESENLAAEWLRKERVKLLNEIRPFKKSEWKYYQALVAKLHVSFGRPVERNSAGEIEIRGRRKP